MAGRKHLIAVNRTVLAIGLDKVPSATATVDFARDLARRMDAAPAGVAPLTLVSAYQSTLKDLTRAGARAGVARPVRVDAKSKSMDVLEAFFRKWKVRRQDRGE